MKNYWTAEEKHIHRELMKVREYPRWESWDGGFIYKACRGGVMFEEVFRFLDGTWSAGSKTLGTWKVFSCLRSALQYGEKMARPRVKAELEKQACMRESLHLPYDRVRRARLTQQAVTGAGPLCNDRLSRSGLTAHPLRRQYLSVSVVGRSPNEEGTHPCF